MAIPQILPYNRPECYRLGPLKTLFPPKNFISPYSKNSRFYLNPPPSQKKRHFFWGSCNFWRTSLIQRWLGLSSPWLIPWPLYFQFGCQELRNMIETKALFYLKLSISVLLLVWTNHKWKKLSQKILTFGQECLFYHVFGYSPKTYNKCLKVKKFKKSFFFHMYFEFFINKCFRTNNKSPPP